MTKSVVGSDHQPQQLTKVSLDKHIQLESRLQNS
eukprot:CAMPEP_0116875428 /NCGR_PEP_ID=MMETSP0463-20121206/7387_1 /TAXON_ID=181622 /ORGANISM="Strombidinopsis sp, Strain SopsisLIS2011" /LENGTH=33 /DNA_ID= /DNA_START= /DNA_END= /DNA_ORIENTATION=